MTYVVAFSTLADFMCVRNVFEASRLTLPRGRRSIWRALTGFALIFAPSLFLFCRDRSRSLLLRGWNSRYGFCLEHPFSFSSD